MIPFSPQLSRSVTTSSSIRSSLSIDSLNCSLCSRENVLSSFENKNKCFFKLFIKDCLVDSAPPAHRPETPP